MAKKLDKPAESESEASALDENQLRLIDYALAAQAPLARAYVERLRKKNPSWDEDELVRQIEKRFIRLATASGIGIGGAAAVPGVGTVMALGLTAGEGIAFAEACAFLTLGVAHARGVQMKDPAARRTVVLGILAGERGQKIVAAALGQRGLQWGNVLGGAGAGGMTKVVNQQVNRWVRRTLFRRAGGKVAGRLVPFGIGAVIGGVGNNALARSMVEASREVFSHAPVTVESTVVDSSDA